MRDETPGDLMKALADSLPPTKAERGAAHTADEWDEIVSGLRRTLAEAECCWREALHAERGGEPMNQGGDRLQQMDPSEREMGEHFVYHWESGPVPESGDCVKLAPGVIAQVEAAHSTNGPYVEARKLVLRRISAREALGLGWVDPEIARPDD